MPLITLTEWFGLKDEHSDFTIETDTDASFFFANRELDAQLQEILRKAFRASKPPKCVLYGDWGSGKTHTMRHLEYIIANTEDFRAKVVFAEFPDMIAKSKFNVAHAALLDALGLAVASGWVMSFNQKLDPEGARQEIKRIAQSEPIATAFSNLAAFGDGNRISWEWLRGQRLSTAEASMTGLSTCLEQSNELVKVLEVLGHLCKSAEDRILVFFLDEATKLGAVNNNDCIAHWTNGFKLIADPQQRDIGIVLSGSWVDHDDMALPIQDEQVKRRFGEDNYIQIQTLAEHDAKEFTTSLLQEWVDPAKRQSIIGDFTTEADGEPIDDTSFPFTVPGLEAFVQHTCRNGGITRPSDIQVTLATIVNRAVDDQRHLLSSSYLSSQINA